MNNYNLEQLGIPKLPFTMCVYGKSDSGKSYFLKYLMREISKSNTKFDFGAVICPTSFNDGYDYVPKKYIFEEFDENIIKNLFSIQKKNVEKNVKKNAFIILDDLLEDHLNNHYIKKLFLNGRHYLISTIVLTQYVHLLKPCIRSNAMFTMCFNCGFGRTEMEALYNMFGGRFKNYDEYKNFYYKNIEDHKFITYRKKTNEYSIFRCPSKIPEFKLQYNKKI